MAIFNSSGKTLISTIALAAFILLLHSLALHSSHVTTTPGRSGSGLSDVIPRAVQPPARKVAVAFGSQATAVSEHLRLTSSRSIHVARAGPDTPFDKAVKSGTCLLGKINGKGEPSLYNDPSDMEGKYGWDLSPGDDQHFPSDLQIAFDALQLSGGAKDTYKLREAAQNRDFTNDARSDNPASYGSSANQFNVGTGVIIAATNYSPKYQLQQQELPAKEENLPQVHQWSDIAWIQWKDLAKGAAGAVKYVIRYHVITPVTKDIIDQVTKSEPGGFATPWPGVDFTMSTKEGKALLGTPHGGGVAWLLVNHRGAIARTKKIAKVTLFTTGGGPDNSDENGKPWYNMIWQLT